MAILLNGSNYFSLDLGGTGPVSSYSFTMVAWFKPPQEFKDWQGFVLSDGSETARFGIGPANYGRWGIYWDTKEARSSGSFSENYSNSSPNSWAHAVGVFRSNGGTNARTMYVNGSSNSFSNGTNITQTLTDADIVGIGYGPTTGSNELYKGEVAECALYSVELTTAEIDILAAGFSPLFVRPDKLLGYWPLGGAFTGALSGADIVGNYNLTATGTIAAADHPEIFYPTTPKKTGIALVPAEVIPGTGMGYALPENSFFDYKVPRSQLEFAAPDNALDYKVQSNGFE